MRLWDPLQKEEGWEEEDKVKRQSDNLNSAYKASLQTQDIFIRVVSDWIVQEWTMDYI